MSPLECSPAPPVRAMPSDARWASRRHWCGSSGASVATITMIEPAPAAVSGRSSYGSGTTSCPITRPTGAPATVSRSRQPWLACTSTPTV